MPDDPTPEDGDLVHEDHDTDADPEPLTPAQLAEVDQGDPPDEDG